MDPRQVIAEVARLAAQRGWAEGDPHETYLLTLYSERETVRSMLHTRIRALRHDLDHLEQMLRAESPILNTLGELQQRPAAVEAAVGEFSAADKALRDYLETFPPKAA